MNRGVREGYKEVQLIGETAEVPEEWNVEELNGHVDILTGCSFDSNLFNNEKKGLPLVRIRNLQESNIDTYYNGEYDDKYIIDNGDILIGMDGNFYVVKWSSKNALLNQRVCRVEASDDLLDQDYLYYQIQPEIKKIHRITPATTVKHLSVKDIRAIRIPVPSYPEQKKIADILSSVDKAIEKTDEIIDKAKKLKKGLMQKLLTKGIGHDEFKEVRIGSRKYKVPDNWDLVKLGKIFKLINGRAFKKDEWSNNGLQIIRIQDLRQNDNSETNYCDFEVDKKYYVKNGDLLFCWAGNINTSLGAYIWNKKKAVLNQHIYNLKSKEKVNKKFYKNYINYMLPLLKTLVGGSAGQIHITQKDLKSFKLLVPPLEEQKKIANILSSVDEKIQKKQEQKEKLEKLKKGLMQKLLTGEVRVEVEE